MKRLFILIIFCCQCLPLRAEESLDRYFSSLRQLDQSQGDHRNGEIEVIIDPMKIIQVQTLQEERLLKKGGSFEQAEERSKIGIVAEDQYWIWFRDAVCFPNGSTGTYIRLMAQNQLKNNSIGVAVLPILPSGHVVLNLNYRHATRSWELELPRGQTDLGETNEEAAERELQEETGMGVSSLIFLGNIAPDTGILASVIPVYLGQISSEGVATPEYSEAIAGLVKFTKEELKEALIQGFAEVILNGQKRQIPIRDSFLTFAILQAEIRKLF